MRKAITFLFLSSVLFINLFSSCSRNDKHESYDYKLSPSDFRPYPLKGDTTPPKKFILSWENPSETRDFRANRIYLDTMEWDKIYNDWRSAPVVLRRTYAKGDPVPERDSILLSFGPIKGEDGIDTLKRYILGEDTLDMDYFLFDSTGRLDSNDLEFHFALVSEHDGRNGQPRLVGLPVGG